MITGELKNKVDNIWDTLWTGGITSPITVLEQITYLMFMKLLDDNQRYSSCEIKDSWLETRSGCRSQPRDAEAIVLRKYFEPSREVNREAPYV